MFLKIVEWLYVHFEDILLIILCVYLIIKGIRLVVSKKPHLTISQRLMVWFQRVTGDEEKAEKEKSRLLKFNDQLKIKYIYIFGGIILLIMVVYDIFTK